MSPTATSIPPTPHVGTHADHSILDRKILPDSDRHLMENEGIVEPVPSRATSRLGLNVGLARDRDGHIIVPGRVSSRFRPYLTEAIYGYASRVHNSALALTFDYS